MERGIGPDATVTLDFALSRLAGMMEKLLVYPERMLANLESLGGVVHSGEVLLALARAGISREDAYAIVQRNAMATWTRLGTAEGRIVSAKIWMPMLKLPAAWHRICSMRRCRRTHICNLWMLFSRESSEKR